MAGPSRYKFSDPQKLNIAKILEKATRDIATATGLNLSLSSATFNVRSTPELPVTTGHQPRPDFLALVAFYENHCLADQVLFDGPIASQSPTAPVVLPALARASTPPADERLQAPAYVQIFPPVSAPDSTPEPQGATAEPEQSPDNSKEARRAQRRAMREERKKTETQEERAQRHAEKRARKAAKNTQASAQAAKAKAPQPPVPQSQIPAPAKPPTSPVQPSSPQPPKAPAEDLGARRKSSVKLPDSREPKESRQRDHVDSNRGKVPESPETVLSDFDKMLEEQDKGAQAQAPALTFPQAVQTPPAGRKRPSPPPPRQGQQQQLAPPVQPAPAAVPPAVPQRRAVPPAAQAERRAAPLVPPAVQAERRPAPPAPPPRPALPPRPARPAPPQRRPAAQVNGAKAAEVKGGDSLRIPVLPTIPGQTSPYVIDPAKWAKLTKSKQTNIARMCENMNRVLAQHKNAKNTAERNSKILLMKGALAFIKEKTG